MSGLQYIAVHKTETLTTERNRKDMDMTTAIDATSGAGLRVAEVERKAGSFFGALREAFADYLAYRTTLAELKSLTNKQLRDNGFERHALPRIALEAVYGK